MRRPTSTSPWIWWTMTSPSFTRLASVTASTKRQDAVVDGLSGGMETKITSLKCMPIDPITPEVAQTAGIEAWVGLFQTMTQGSLDIDNGDQFIVGSVTYKVRAAVDWYWSPTVDNTTLIILEKLA